MNRRHLLRVALSAVLLGLAACKKIGPSFASVNIEGAHFGRDFHLTDQYGKPCSLANFRGNAVLLFFGFTQCPDVCPAALARATEVRKKLGVEGKRLQILFVTLDPERDSPVVLKAYMAAFDPTFIALYTDLQGTRQVAKDFHIFYQKVPTGRSYTLDHTALSYLFDPAGRLRLAVRHDESADQVAADVHALLQADSLLLKAQ